MEGEDPSKMIIHRQVHYVVQKSLEIILLSLSYFFFSYLFSSSLTFLRHCDQTTLVNMKDEEENSDKCVEVEKEEKLERGEGDRRKYVKD